MSNYINIFLLCVPVGILAGALNWNPLAVFILNLLALMPLGELLYVVIGDISYHVGPLVDVLLNIAFGNGVELIVSRHGIPRSRRLYLIRSQFF
jgi:Ca2+:H+ antiporter